MSGPWTQDTLGWSGYTVVSSGPWQGAGGLLVLPPFSGDLTWGPTVVPAVGFSLSADWSPLALELRGGVSSPFEVPLDVDGNPAELSFSPLSFWAVSGGWESLRFGVFRGDGEGGILAGESPLGRFAAWALGGFWGVGDFLGFYTKVSGQAQARFRFLDWEPFRLQGEFRAQLAGFAGKCGWSWGDWRFLGEGAVGLLWVDSGELLISQTLPGTSGSLVTTGHQVVLSASPAVFFVIRPEVAWSPSSSLRVRLSRWLPWAGNWSMDRVSVAASSGGSGTSSPGRPSSASGWSKAAVANALLLGWELNFDFLL